MTTAADFTMETSPNPTKRTFAMLFSGLAILLILFACIAFLSDGRPVLGWNITKWQSLVPGVVGVVFLIAGVSMMNRS